jgi:hypothetical protein
MHASSGMAILGDPQISKAGDPTTLREIPIRARRFGRLREVVR